MKKLFKALAILTSFSVLTRALGFLFRIFLSRSLGAEGLGVYQIAFSVFMVLETFVSSGLPLVVSKTTSYYSSSKQKNMEFSIVTTSLLIGLITAIFLCLFVLLFKNLFAMLFTDNRCLMILITLLPGLIFSSVYAILRGNLWGHRKYFLCSLTEFLEQVIRIISCILMMGLFYLVIDNIFIASISYLLSSFFSAIIVLIIYLKIGHKFKKPTLNNFKAISKSSTPITLVRTLSSLLTPIISIIMPIQLLSIGYTSEQALSIFGIAMGMTFPLLYIPSTLAGSLSMTLIPDLSCAVSQQNFREVNSKIHFSIKFGLFVSFLFIPIFIPLGEQIGLFLYDNSLSGNFLSYSAIMIIPICISGITVSCLNALNLELRSFINYIIGALFLIFCIFFLTKYLEILSLVWGLGLCLTIASLLNLILLNKKLNDNFFNFQYLLKLIICTLPSILITKWISQILSNYLSIFFVVCISASICEIFFLTLAFILNVYNFSFLKLKNKNKF